MATVRNERLHKDEPLLMPGLTAFAHWGGEANDDGTVHVSDRRKRSFRGEDINGYRKRIKRERKPRHRTYKRNNEVVSIDLL